jgi:hypothetical protein
MKRVLLIALLLTPVPALAATSITVMVGGVQEVWNLSDTDQQKFEAWVQSAYKCTPPPSEPTTPPATPCTALTLEESEALWAKATLQGTADNVQRFQNTVAATAAVNATTPIGFNVKGPATTTTKKPAETPKK